MRVDNVFIVLATLISIAVCENQDLLKIEFELPTFLQTVLKTVLASQNMKMRSGVVQWNWNDPWGKDDGFLMKISTQNMQVDRRSQKQRKPSVEAGPGVQKTEIITYPPKYFESRLKHLIKLQKKQDLQNKQA